MAGIYIKAVTPALPLGALRNCFRAYLTAMGSVIGVNSITATSTIATPILAWVLITHMGWGLWGAAAAYVIGG